jgi:peptidoglycan/LPS O-acetylase OafA/YrhL
MIWASVFHGGAAVILFFVLSGFVMGLNVDLTPGLTPKLFGEFILRRALRLYPVVFVAILFAMVTSHYVFEHHFDVDETIDLLLLQKVDVDPPLWSIKVEAAVSAIYPFLLFIVMWGGNAARGLILPVTIFCYFMGYGPQLILAYLSAFVLGLLIPYLGKDVMTGLGPKWSLLLLPVAFFTYSSGNIIGYYQLLPPSPPIFLQTIGAFYIVAFVLVWGDKIGWLDSAPLRWLGRISFSLYALHYPIVMSVSELFKDLPFWQQRAAILVTSVPLSLLIAAGASRLIERPFQQLGRRLAPMQPLEVTCEANPGRCTRD